MPRKEVDEIRLAAWRSLNAAHANLVALIDRELTAADCLRLSCYEVLSELVAAPENRLRLNELAQNVGLSRSGLTRLVDKLESAGLLRRQAATDDRRGAFAVLTEKGKAVVRKSQPVYENGIAKYFMPYVTKEEAQLLGDVFARILEATQKNDS